MHLCIIVWTHFNESWQLFIRHGGVLYEARRRRRNVLLSEDTGKWRNGFELKLVSPN